MVEPVFTFKVVVQPKAKKFGKYTNYEWVKPLVKKSIEEYLEYSHGEPFETDLKLIEIDTIEINFVPDSLHKQRNVKSNLISLNGGKKK